jgi:hypothetical protein
VEGDALGHEALGVGHLLGLDGDVGGLALHAAEGWCIMIRAWGSAKRLPGSPAHSRNWPIDAPRPMQMVPTSGWTNCMVS